MGRALRCGTNSKSDSGWKLQRPITAMKFNYDRRRRNRQSRAVSLPVRMVANPGEHTVMFRASVLAALVSTLLGAFVCQPVFADVNQQPLNLKVVTAYPKLDW